MKSKFIILSAVVLMFSASQVFAGEGHDHGTHSEAVPEGDEETTHAEEISPDAVNIGNKICPVSGELISDVGDGKGVQIEHKGKIYNVCCKFCAKDFKKDPEKFIKIIENNLAEGIDPGSELESDHHEEAEHEHGEEEHGHAEEEDVSHHDDDQGNKKEDDHHGSEEHGDGDHDHQ